MLILILSELKLIYSHKDQVLRVPEGAVVLLGDDFCPNAAFNLNNQVVGVQGHPEFTAVYTRRLLGRRQAHIGVERFESAMDTLAQETDADYIGQCLMDWMDGGALRL